MGQKNSKEASQNPITSYGHNEENNGGSEQSTHRKNIFSTNKNNSESSSSNIPNQICNKTDGHVTTDNIGTSSSYFLGKTLISPRRPIRSFCNSEKPLSPLVTTEENRKRKISSVTDCQSKSMRLNDSSAKRISTACVAVEEQECDEIGVEAQEHEEIGVEAFEMTDLSKNNGDMNDMTVSNQNGHQDNEGIGENGTQSEQECNESKEIVNENGEVNKDNEDENEDPDLNSLPKACTTNISTESSHKMTNDFKMTESKKDSTTDKCKVDADFQKLEPCNKIFTASSEESFYHHPLAGSTNSSTISHMKSKSFYLTETKSPSISLPSLSFDFMKAFLNNSAGAASVIDDYLTNDKTDVSECLSDLKSTTGPDSADIVEDKSSQDMNIVECTESENPKILVQMDSSSEFLQRTSYSLSVNSNESKVVISKVCSMAEKDENTPKRSQRLASLNFSQKCTTPDKTSPPEKSCINLKFETSLFYDKSSLLNHPETVAYIKCSQVSLLIILLENI